MPDTAGDLLHRIDEPGMERIRIRRVLQRVSTHHKKKMLHLTDIPKVLLRSENDMLRLSEGRGKDHM